MPSREDAFDGGREGASPEPIDLEQGAPMRASEWHRYAPRVRVARDELRWFYGAMRGRVPAAPDASPAALAAAVRVFEWLSELLPNQRGALLVRYDGRRWPVRLVRRFGGLTSVVVRLWAVERTRGSGETFAQSEHAAVVELLSDVAAAGRSPDLACASSPETASKKLRRLERAALEYVRAAEGAYLRARGAVPCVVPAGDREGA